MVWLHDGYSHFRIFASRRSLIASDKIRILQQKQDFSVAFELHYITDNLSPLLEGAFVTLEVSLLSIALGLLVGTVLTCMRQSSLPGLAGFVLLYVSFIRGTPALIQVLMVYYALPSIGLNLPPFPAGVIALGMNSGAYVTEILRGGLAALPAGQIEAARSVGMPTPLIWRRIILPQVFVMALPALTGEAIGLLKLSSLLSVITIVELTRSARRIVATTYKPIEIYIAVAILYFMMCFTITLVTRRLEKLTSVYRV